MRKTSFKLSPVALSLAMLPASAVLAANTSTTTMSVAATVADTCAVSASNLSFLVPIVGGAVATNVDSNATVTVICSSGTAYNVVIGAGGNQTGGVRQLVKSDDTGAFLKYKLYRSDAHRVAGTPDIATSGGTQGGGGATGAELADQIAGTTADVLTVYGRIAAADNSTGVAAGSYSDSLTITVNY